MTTITVHLATDNEEKVMDALQPLLEIAEGKKSIEDWNDRATDLINVVNSLISSVRLEGVQEERERIKKTFLIWARNHPDVWHISDNTEPWWWVQNLLGDVFGKEIEETIKEALSPTLPEGKE